MLRGTHLFLQLTSRLNKSDIPHCPTRFLGEHKHTVHISVSDRFRKFHLDNQASQTILIMHFKLNYKEAVTVLKDVLESQQDK